MEIKRELLLNRLLDLRHIKVIIKSNINTA